MELLPPLTLLNKQVERSGRLWGGAGAQVVARRLLENGDRQPGDTSLNKAVATGEERPRLFSFN